MMTSDDLAFLSAFEECTLGKACWSHDAHVRMAWLKLERHGSLEGALAAIREGIQRYNDSQGGTGYHETVTTAFTHVIAYRRLLASERDQTWQSFQAAHPDLFEK